MHSSRIRPIASVAALIGAIVLATGSLACSTKTRCGMWSKNTLEGDLVTALEDPSPNQRLQALARIVNYSSPLPEVAFDSLSTIARTDKNTQVRSAAIRALQSHLSPSAIDPIVLIVLFKDHPDQVITPKDQVIWDAFVALSDVCDQGLLPDQHRDAVRDHMIKTLLSRDDRNIRMAAAYILQYFPIRPALEALIGAIREEDFGICYEAEHALIAMTGKTHQYDADAWLAWLQQTDDPFADTGQTPEGLPQPYKSRWRKQWDDFKDRMAWRNTDQDQ